MPMDYLRAIEHAEFPLRVTELRDVNNVLVLKAAGLLDADTETARTATVGERTEEFVIVRYITSLGRKALLGRWDMNRAIRSGDLLFVSGQVGSRSDGSPEPEFEAQVRLAFANLAATLKAGECELDDIVDVTTFHTDPQKQFGTVMTVKGEVFPQAPYPNWTAVGVTWLAGFDFEIKVIARIPS